MSKNPTRKDGAMMVIFYSKKKFFLLWNLKPSLHDTLSFLAYASKLTFDMESKVTHKKSTNMINW
jgi:hypothetical protein